MTKRLIAKKTPLIRCLLLAFTTICIFAGVNQILADNVVTGQGYAQQESSFGLAMTPLDKVIHNDPTNPILYCTRARLYFSEHEYNKAINDCNKAIDLDSNYIDSYYIKGFAYYKLTNYEECILNQTEGIRLNPNNGLAYHIRGEAYAKLRQFDNAIADYNMAIQLGAVSAKIFGDRGLAYAGLEEYDKAIADYSKAIEFAPFSADAYSTRGLLYSMVGNYLKGIGDCEKAVKLDPDNEGANNNLAWLLAVAPDAKLRDGKRALEYAKKACDLTGWNDPYDLGTIAAAYAANGDYDKAVKWEKKSIELGLPKSELGRSRQMLSLFENQRPFVENK